MLAHGFQRARVDRAINIGDHITNADLGVQALADNVQLALGQQVVQRGQHAGFVAVHVQQARGAFGVFELQFLEVDRALGGAGLD